MTNEPGTTAISRSEDPAGPEPIGVAEPEPADVAAPQPASEPAEPIADTANPGSGTQPPTDDRDAPDDGEPVGRNGTTDGSRPTRDEPSEPPSAIGAGWLAVLALIWFATMLRSVQVSLQSPGAGAMGVIEAAYGLPAVISAALVGGAAVGLAVLRLFRGGLHTGRPWARFAAALGAGLVIGIAAAAFAMLGQQNDGSAMMALGGTIAAAATIGGAVAGVRASAIVGAGVAASLGVFLLTFLRELFKGELLSLFGADDSPASLLTAQGWLAGAASLAGGLVAGLIAFFYLRRATRHAAPPTRWPAYLVAGASAGAMMLLTEVITRIGGAQMLALARSVSDSDNAFQDMANSSRINAGLVVLFVGAITAIIAFGRTLRPAEPIERGEAGAAGERGEAAAAGERGEAAAPGEPAR